MAPIPLSEMRHVLNVGYYGPHCCDSNSKALCFYASTHCWMKRANFLTDGCCVCRRRETPDVNSVIEWLTCFSRSGIHLGLFELLTNAVKFWNALSTFGRIQHETIAVLFDGLVRIHCRHVCLQLMSVSSICAIFLVFLWLKCVAIFFRDQFHFHFSSAVPTDERDTEVFF